MDDEERERIIAETRRNLDPARRKAERMDMAERLMQQPIADPVARFKQEAEDQEARPLFAKRAMRAEEQRRAAAAAAAHAVDWEAWVCQQLKAQRDFIVEITGQALGQIAETLRDEFADKVTELNRELKHERATHDQLVEQLKAQFNATQKLHLRELAVTNQQVKALQQQVSTLQVALHTKREGQALREDLHDGLAMLRDDIKRKVN